MRGRSVVNAMIGCSELRILGKTPFKLSIFAILVGKMDSNDR